MREWDLVVIPDHFILHGQKRQRSMNRNEGIVRLLGKKNRLYRIFGASIIIIVIIVSHEIKTLEDAKNGCRESK